MRELCKESKQGADTGHYFSRQRRLELEHRPNLKGFISIRKGGNKLRGYLHGGTMRGAVVSLKPSFLCFLAQAVQV